MIGGRWTGSWVEHSWASPRCCTESGRRSRLMCCVAFWLASCAPWPPTRTTSGRSRHSSITASIRLIRRNLKRPRLFDWQVMFFWTMVGLRFVQTELFRYFPNKSIFSVESPDNFWVYSLIYAASVAAVGIEIKVFNSVRIQIKLEEQERLLLHARMEALQNQINPHFLFNTLNSISSLVRFDPDMARAVIFKLATILRRLLNSGEAFSPLREEFEFIDNYLDIEVVRFGRDKLRVVKEFDPASLDVVVPSMLLQPLVENSIKHGLSPKVEGGSIYLAQPAHGFTADH